MTEAEKEDVPLPHITCPRCGCVVGDQKAHGDWHQLLDRIMREAGTWDSALRAAMKDLTG